MWGQSSLVQRKSDNMYAFIQIAYFQLEMKASQFISLLKFTCENNGYIRATTRQTTRFSVTYTDVVRVSQQYSWGWLASVGHMICGSPLHYVHFYVPSTHESTDLIRGEVRKDFFLYLDLQQYNPGYYITCTWYIKASNTMWKNSFLKKRWNYFHCFHYFLLLLSFSSSCFCKVPWAIGGFDAPLSLVLLLLHLCIYRLAYCTQTQHKQSYRVKKS